MRLSRAMRQYGLIALGIPGILLLTGISTLADASPTPSASGSALPGDPAKGQAAYNSAGCTACHGASLEGGVGATLNPIEKMPGITDNLDPTYLISIITNGRQHQPGDPRQTDMPAKGGSTSLTSDDIQNIAAFIIQQNREGSPPLTANELAKRTMTWVGIAILGMLFITYLLAQYNMRWIARRAAARRQK
jgi:mono/diheme cytochrome c family protein